MARPRRRFDPPADIEALINSLRPGATPLPDQPAPPPIAPPASPPPAPAAVPPTTSIPPAVNREPCGVGDIGREPERESPPLAGPPAPAAGRRRRGTGPTAEGYEAHKERARQRQAEQSAAGRDIGPIPDVVDPERRERGRESLEAFAREYFPRRFRLAFSSSHRAAIERLEACSLDGGLLAVAMPRGSGKTTLAEVAVMRAILCGMRRYVVLVAATATHAAKSLKRIQIALEQNHALLEDFPEAIYPIKALERIHNRARGQTCQGEPTLIEWTAEGVRFPTVRGSCSAGAVIQVAGIEGAIRGAQVTGPDGEAIRPDMVVIDDAQTRDTATSPLQTGNRAAIVQSDILGLAGPDVQIACVMLCTVICPNDLSEQFLNVDLNPEWSSIRTRMIERWPSRMDLWDEYAEIRRVGLREGDDGRAGNEFYAANREAMDVGAVVSWPERMKPTEASGLQSAMNLWIRNPAAFDAEYQNAPKPPAGAAGSKSLRADIVAARVTGTPRSVVPRESVKLTAFIDLGTHLHWYAVGAWDSRFGGVVVDYGPWPRQRRSVFAYSDSRPTLREVYPQAASEPEWVYAGLADLVGVVLGKVYNREGTGEELRIERCLIDCGWLTETVYQFLRVTPFGGSLTPSKGIARTETSLGVAGWKPRPGEQAGYHWRLTMSETGRGRQCQFDPDQWKSFLYDRLTTSPGGAGHLGFYGNSAAEHEMMGLHLAAEESAPKLSRGVAWDKWSKLPGDPDNHLLDCVVGCAVAASVCGLKFSATGEAERPAPAAKPLKLSDIQRMKREAAGR